MIIIIVALLLLGFFFSPAWLALIGYLIYIFASRKSRRDEAVEGRLEAMIASKKMYATFNELYFEGARSFAIAKGERALEENAASAHVLINGTQYFVTFLRANSGGTEIILDLSSNVEKRVTAHFSTDNSRDNPPSRSVRDEMDSVVEELMGVKNPKKFVEEYLSNINDFNFLSADERPTWFEGKAELCLFFLDIAFQSRDDDVAEAYVAGMLKQDDFRKLMFSCVAAAESGGFDFEFQKSVAAAIVRKGWEQLDGARKAQLRHMPGDAIGVALELSD